MRIKYWSENLKGKYHLGDLGIDSKLTINWISRKRERRPEGVDWIQMAQCRV
jgi:hypothetical protein